MSVTSRAPGKPATKLLIVSKHNAQPPPDKALASKTLRMTSPRPKLSLLTTIQQLQAAADPPSATGISAAAAAAPAAAAAIVTRKTSKSITWNHYGLYSPTSVLDYKQVELSKEAADATRMLLELFNNQKEQVIKLVLTHFNSPFYLTEKNKEDVTLTKVFGAPKNQQSKIIEQLNIIFPVVLQQNLKNQKAQVKDEKSSQALVGLELQKAAFADAFLVLISSPHFEVKLLG